MSRHLTRPPPPDDPSHLAPGPSCARRPHRLNPLPWHVDLFACLSSAALAKLPLCPSRPSVHARRQEAWLGCYCCSSFFSPDLRGTTRAAHSDSSSRPCPCSSPSSPCVPPRRLRLRTHSLFFLRGNPESAMASRESIAVAAPPKMLVSEAGQREQTVVAEAAGGFRGVGSGWPQ